MTTPDRAALIATYRDGYDEIMRALDGITDEELDRPEAAGEWSPRRAVVHMADSEMNAALRIMRMVSEPDLPFQGYDEGRMAEKLYFDDRPIEHSLAAFKAARDVTAELLDLMTEEDWASSEPGEGSLSADDWLRIYSGHAHAHADQIRRARSANAS